MVKSDVTRKKWDAMGSLSVQTTGMLHVSKLKAEEYKLRIIWTHYACTETNTTTKSKFK
jgi:hypothetical protein